MKKRERILTILSFGALATVILAMMAATILEKTHGSSFAFRWVYHNPVFFVLWAVAAVAGLCLVVPRTAKRPWTLLLHVSFVVILAGALLTHLLGEQGFVRLPKGETVSTWIRDDGTARPLPRPITLEDFEVLYYAGSEAPADYHSRIRVEDRVMDISMNHIARVDGYRLFQSGFDEHSSTLAVNHDPWGIGVSYTGYVLLLLSLIGFFFQRGTVFRKTLGRVLKSSAFLAAFLFLSMAEAGAKDVPKVLPKEVADRFGDLYVYYNDRVCPFETMAREYTLKAYGKSHWDDYDACQVVTGWLFYYDWWKDVPFKLKARTGAR